MLAIKHLGSLLIRAGARGNPDLQ